VKALRASRGKFRPGRPVGSKNAIRPLTGLLFCGVCGGPLYTITGMNRRVKVAKPYVDYGCGARRRGGPSVCSNGRMMSERKLRAAILEHTTKFLSSKKFDEWVERGRQRLLEAMRRENEENKEAAPLAEAIRTREARVERIVEMVASGAGSSDLLKRKLSAEEDKLVALRGKVSRLLTPRATDKLPRVDADALRTQLERLGEIFDSRPEEARSALQKFIRRVVLSPTTEGVNLKISLVSSMVLPSPENSAAVVDLGT
jgi:hypothetical protein